ncbi:TlpA family protein disulfide reductase [Pontibacter sp. MBLB2868]|uniref:TlpA family protein disulfide reductase n=1 Tax=Pontibacter sp. MBLB2868 TaxID=3451555 RepID=UPI003F74FB41
MQNKEKATANGNNFIRFVNNAPGKVDAIQFMNEFGDNELHEFHGADTLRIAASRAPTLLFLSRDLKASYFPTQLRETIFIEDDSTGGFYLRTGNPIRDNELNFCRLNLQYKLVGDKLGKSEVEKEFKNKELALRDFLKNHEVSPGFGKYMTSLIETFKLKKEIARASKEKDFSGLLGYASLLNENSFPESDPFKSATYNLAKLMSDSLKATGNMGIEKQYELIKKLNLKKDIEDFLLFTMMKFYKPSNSLSEFEKTVHRYNPNKAHIAFKEYLQKNLELAKLETKNANEDLLVQIDGNTTMLHKVLDKQKGKVIVVDFWASWCAPCIAQFPHSKKLEESLQDEDVVFMSISMDKDRYRWEKRSGELKLNPGANYLMVSNFESQLASSLKISEIPRYIIINKSGQIVNRNAPRPQDPELLEEVRNLLK